MGAEVKQNRPLAGERVLTRSKCREVHRLDVLAVCLDELHAVGGCALPELVHGERELLGRGRRLRPAVVFEHEDGRHLPELREVQ
jgi:hypothetical protein